MNFRWTTAFKIALREAAHLPGNSIRDSASRSRRLPHRYWFSRAFHEMLLSQAHPHGRRSLAARFSAAAQQTAVMESLAKRASIYLITET